MGDGPRKDARQAEGVNVRNPELTYRGGAIAADAITLRLAARKFEQTYNIPKILLPKVVAESKGDLFSNMATISVVGERVEVAIDTGKMTWAEPLAVKKDEFTDYKNKKKQSALFTEGGVVVKIGEVDVSRKLMRTPQGEIIFAWFAQLPEAQAEHLGRYTLISKAQGLTSAYSERLAREEGELYPKISVPAADFDYRSDLPEITEANPVVKSGEQKIRFTLDYTGARVRAQTALTLKAMPIKDRTFEFGSEGPVMYWFTEKEDTTPFAVSVTKPEAWLTPNTSADFHW